MKKILIIEDDPDVLEILWCIFNNDTFEPTISSNSLSVDLITNLSPDIILLDHRLRDRFGCDVCKEIKACPAISGIPVIILSACMDLPKLANDCYADGFIEKPFDVDELYNYIERFCI